MSKVSKTMSKSFYDIDTTAIRQRVEKNYQKGLAIIKARDEIVRALATAEDEFIK